MTALIISGGDYFPIPDLSCDYVIACDLGYLHAEKMGIRPDLILGDFDSAPVPDGKIPVEQHPVRKDDTDTMLAVKKALSLGYADLVMACAFGGRLDHAYANIQAGAYAAEQGEWSGSAVPIRKPGSSVTGRWSFPAGTVIPSRYSAFRIPARFQSQALNMNAIIS